MTSEPLAHDELIEAVLSGEMTVEAAAKVAHPYFKYYEPPRNEFESWRQAANAIDALESEPVAVHEDATPSKGGQLWEDCEYCGSEGPVYEPLHRCAKCWPRG